MFGEAGPPKRAPVPDVTTQPTDQLESITRGEPRPVAKIPPVKAPPPVEWPEPSPVEPGRVSPLTRLKPPVEPPPKVDSPRGESPPLARPRPVELPPKVDPPRVEQPPRAPEPPKSPLDPLKQKVLDHTARLRRELMGESGGPGAEPPSPKGPPAPAPPPEPEPEPEPIPVEPGAEDSKALRRAVLEKTQKTTLRDLEKKGLKNVAVLGMRTIEKIVNEAVENAIAKRGLSATQKRTLEQDAKREFLELMDEHRRALAEKSDEERRGLDLQKQVDKLRSELARQEAVLTEQRESATIAISASSLAELEATCKRVLQEFMTAERRALAAHANPKAEEGLGALEKKLGEAFDRLVGRLKSDYEDLLERRIEKLNKALADTENALRHMAQLKSLDPGIASLYRTIQGLSLDEAYFERKKELLAVVFLENLQIQGKEVTATDREAAVIKSSLESQRPALEAPPDFEPPLDPLTTETAF